MFETSKLNSDLLLLRPASVRHSSLSHCIQILVWFCGKWRCQFCNYALLSLSPSWIA